MTPESAGRISAAAVLAQRDTERWAARYAGALPVGSIGPTCLVHAFVYHWLTEAQLRCHNRMSTWTFGLDDAYERTRDGAAIAQLAARCMAVVRGTTTHPTEPLLAALADIRRGLTSSPLWTPLRQRWTAVFAETLDALGEERRTAWLIRNGAPRPTLAEYLELADSALARLVYLTHWMSLGSAGLPGYLDDLLAAAAESQVAIRLANDLRSVGREQRHQPGELNVLLLGIAHESVNRRIQQAVDDCYAMLRHLIARSVPEAIGLDRLTRTAVAFYKVTDYR